MIDLIRPEVRNRMVRWREVIASGGVTLFGLWALGAPGPVLKGVGVVAVITGAALTVIAVRRVAFAGSGDEPGVVSIDEGQIAYFGPEVGGAISVPSLSEIRLRNDDQRFSWFLITDTGEALSIPHGARDASLLFDVFAALPGFDMDEMLRQLRATQTGSVTVWRRPNVRGLTSLPGRDSR
jgi:hypothetical protein